MSLLKDFCKYWFDYNNKEPKILIEEGKGVRKEFGFKYVVKNIDDEPKDIFSDIIGYQDVKKIINSMLSNLPVSIILDGPAGCGKSMFLHAIDEHYQDRSRYVNGSKVTKAGLFKILFDDKDNQIKILCINEIDKMDTDTQETLLDLLEEGIVSETLKSNVREKRYDNISVFATSNDIENLIYPLQTRMFKINIKPYTERQFWQIGQKVIAHLSIDVQNHIIHQVWTTKKNPNIRDVKQIGKLCNNDLSMVDLLLRNSD
jgi:Holliday junction resolvasome RuvABC ATP-dependent DNA helicase subunit